MDVITKLIETDKAYLAGVFDGEGSINNPKKHLGRFALTLKLGMTDDEVPKLFLGAFAGGSYTIIPPKQSGWKTEYLWYACGQRARQVLKVLLPYLRTKKRLAEIAMEMEQYAFKRNNPIRKKLMAEFDRLNTKGVFIPEESK